MTFAEALVDTRIDDRYCVDRLVSADANRATYLGRHRHLGEPVWLKVLCSPDPAQHQRFLREARILYSIRHPHIAEVRDFGQLADQRGYLVMEPLPSPTLATLLDQGALPPARACHLAAQVAHGLHAVHQRGVVHRGLRPECIALSAHGDRVKLDGFALAAVASDEALTTDGALIGHPEYLSPEQARGQRAEPRSDQYALGCVLYHMVCAPLPFSTPSSVEILLMHQQVQPHLPTQLPGPLRRVLARLLAKDPAQRFPSMAEVAEQLTSLAEERPRLLCLLASPERRDQALQAQLLKHLQALQDRGLLRCWHLGLTALGADVQQELREKLRDADLVAVLISPDLLGSPLMSHLPELRRRQQEGELQLLPLLLRPTLLAHTPLEGLALLPRDGRALSQASDRDAALQHIAAALAQALRP